jgi:hypothetical protein
MRGYNLITSSTIEALVSNPSFSAKYSFAKAKAFDLSLLTLSLICDIVHASFKILLVVVIVLAIVGLGWKTFSIGVINGFDRALDVSTPLVKDLTQQATEYIIILV